MIQSVREIAKGRWRGLLPELGVASTYLNKRHGPCPICGGTTDIDLLGHAYCHSCRQEWTLAGEPIVEDDGGIWRQPIGTAIEPSPEIDSRPRTCEQPIRSISVESQLDVRPNYTPDPVTENIDLESQAKGIRFKRLPGRFQSLFRSITGIAK